MSPVCYALFAIIVVGGLAVLYVAYVARTRGEEYGIKLRE